MTEITHVSCVEYCCCLMPLIYSLLQCSASCGQGYRQRLISCSEVHVENDNYEYGHQSLSNCPGTPPESYMPCNLDPCPPPQEWRVGIWGLVSVFVSLNVVQSFIRIVDVCFQSQAHKMKYNHEILQKQAEGTTTDGETEVQKCQSNRSSLLICD